MGMMNCTEFFFESSSTMALELKEKQSRELEEVLASWSKGI